MGKLTVVLVDLDENYSMALEKKFVEEIGEYANISVITDMSYYNEFFSTLKYIDILIISEQLYSEQLSEHNISYTYILTENPVEMNSSNYNLIYKYTSVQEVFSHVISNEALKPFIKVTPNGERGVILVYSPVGGVGKTTIALGLAISLVQSGKRAIYISVDDLQGAGYFFDDTSVLPPGFERQMFSIKNDGYEVIRSNIAHRIIDYLPPFSKSLTTLNISLKEYADVIEVLKSSGEYDYIIVDMDSKYSLDVSNMVYIADMVLILTTQQKSSCYKISKMIENMDRTQDEKYRFICNKYNERFENYLVNYTNLFYVSEYIYYDPTVIDAKIEGLFNNQEIQKVSEVLKS